MFDQLVGRAVRHHDAFDLDVRVIAAESGNALGDDFVGFVGEPLQLVRIESVPVQCVRCEVCPGVHHLELCPELGCLLEGGRQCGLAQLRPVDSDHHRAGATRARVDDNRARRVSRDIHTDRPEEQSTNSPEATAAHDHQRRIVRGVDQHGAGSALDDLSGHVDGRSHPTRLRSCLVYVLFRFLTDDVDDVLRDHQCRRVRRGLRLIGGQDRQRLSLSPGGFCRPHGCLEGRLRSIDSDNNCRAHH